MNYSGIKYTDMINGEGIRVSIFVSGCSHYCEDCFNIDTWDPSSGKPFTEEIENEILNYIGKYESTIKGISLLGGDPTYDDNIIPLSLFIRKFKTKFPNKSIWMWTGYEWETLVSNSKFFPLISLCNVVIDGKFDKEQKDLSLKWCGSRNQRVIDVEKSLGTDQIHIYKS